MNKQLFNKICDEVIDSKRSYLGIGTLGEKTVHLILKNYFERNTSNHEIKIDGYVADIFNGQEIIEIQTRSFDRLRKKIPVFLSHYPLTIVYPVPYIKWIRWVNPKTGEISPPRKSPRKGSPYNIFPELYKIKNNLIMPNLMLRIVLLNMEEYRFLDGWSKDKKKGSTRCDRIPIDLVDEIYISGIEEYKLLSPDDLEHDFTVKDYQKASGLSYKASSIAVHVLNYVGAIKKIGSRTRSYLYSRAYQDK